MPILFMTKQLCRLDNAMTFALLTEQQLEPPKKRGRRSKQDQASQALVVSPNGAAREKKQSKEKSISQCSPKKFQRLVLEDEKMKDVLARIKEVAEKIDWKCVLDIQPVKQNKQLEVYLIGCFDEACNRFMINGVPIDIKPLVRPIVGLSNEGNAVNRGSDYDEVLYDLFTVNGKSIPAKDGIKFLNKDVDELAFCICFVLAAMGFIFGPKANRCLDREYLPFFFGLKVNDLKNMKWCDLIADLLIEAIKKFNASQRPFKKCGGCLLVPVGHGGMGFPGQII
ncbi:hypothetical protein VPH35_040834 [Triticum aestivum]